MLHRNVVQAKGACAFLAIEMSMAGSMVVRVVMGAKFVVECTFSVFEGMDNVVFEKECQHAEDARLIHRQQYRLHCRKTHGAMLVVQRFQNEDAVSCWAHALLLQHFFGFITIYTIHVWILRNEIFLLLRRKVTMKRCKCSN